MEKRVADNRLPFFLTNYSSFYLVYKINLSIFVKRKGGKRASPFSWEFVVYKINLFV